MEAIKKTLDIIYGLIIAFLLVVAVLLILSRFSTPLKIMAFNVQSGSMEPAVRTGSVVFVRPADKYDIGDVITFRSRESIKQTFTHRIVGVSLDTATGKEQFKTKGDANEDVDISPLAPDLILGRVFFTIPFLGYPVSYAKTPLGFILLIITPAVLIIFSELLSIKNEAVKAREARKVKKAPSLWTEPSSGLFTIASITSDSADETKKTKKRVPKMFRFGKD